LHERAFHFFDLAVDLEGRRVGIVRIADDHAVGTDAGFLERQRPGDILTVTSLSRSLFLSSPISTSRLLFSAFAAIS
jgi:hypothetical protein